jgi:ABC-2 type transport system permease protein
VGSKKGMLKFFGAMMRTNFAMAIEYRSSFVTQVIGMMINDSMWVFFWMLYFEKFPVLNGWGRQDLFVLWAVITFSFGIAFGLFAQALRLSDLISQGQIDYYLTLPKNVLLHILVGQIRPANLGDLFFGPILLALFVDMSPEKWLWFLVGGTLGGLIYLSFFVIVGSLAFFMGSSEGLAGGVGNALIHFSTYPTRIFNGWTRVILFTVIPAGFIAEVPVDLVRRFAVQDLVILVGAALIFSVIAVFVFHRGLRRYESGNLISLRS